MHCTMQARQDPVLAPALWGTLLRRQAAICIGRVATLLFKQTKRARLQPLSTARRQATSRLAHDGIPPSNYSTCGLEGCTLYAW